MLILEDGNEVPLLAGHLQQLEPEQGWGSWLGDSYWEKLPRTTAETTPASRPSGALSPASDLYQAQCPALSSVRTQLCVVPKHMTCDSSRQMLSCHCSS